MKPEVRDALCRYLLAVADDELMLGYRDSEWTGVAPIVEEDIAFSSLAQDEIGHARLFYAIAAELTGVDVDRLALSRPKQQYYHARLLDIRAAPKYDPAGQRLERGNWALAIGRRFLYDLFDDVRGEMLAGTSYAPLAEAEQKIRREERYHLRHGQIWWHALAEGSGEGRSRFLDALERLWPDILGLFEPVPGEETLRAEGLLSGSPSDLLGAWLERIRPDFERHQLPFPAALEDGRWQLRVTSRLGGRLGRHGSSWDELYDEMTMVRRLEPEGMW